MTLPLCECRIILRTVSQVSSCNLSLSAGLQATQQPKTSAAITTEPFDGPMTMYASLQKGIPAMASADKGWGAVPQNSTFKICSGFALVRAVPSPESVNPNSLQVSHLVKTQCMYCCCRFLPYPWIYYQLVSVLTTRAESMWARDKHNIVGNWYTHLSRCKQETAFSVPLDQG